MASFFMGSLMQDIAQSTLYGTTGAEQCMKVDLWAYDLTAIGGERVIKQVKKGTGGDGNVVLV